MPVACTAAMLAVFACALSLQAGEPEKKEAATPAQVAEWIRDLGSDDFAQRGTAEEQLKSAGEAARTELEAATKSTDPEVQGRAKRLLGILQTEPILKKMEAALAAAKSLEADMLITYDMGMKMEMKGHFKGQIDARRFKMKMNLNAGGMQMEMSSFGDGKHIWVETAGPDGKPATVQKTPLSDDQKNGMNQSPLAYMQSVREQYRFTEPAERKLADLEVYVLTGKLKEGAPAVPGLPVTSTRLYVGKKDLMMHKIEMLNDNGDVLMSMEMTNIKTGQTFKDEEFSYKPPPGVQVIEQGGAIHEEVPVVVPVPAE